MACRLAGAKPLSDLMLEYLLLSGPLGTNLSEISIEIYAISIQKNAFENVVLKMAAIMSRPQCVNLGALWNNKPAYTTHFEIWVIRSSSTSFCLKHAIHHSIPS